MDGISNISLKNESSGENDYSETSGSGKLSEKVLTPIVSLELDDIGLSHHLKREGEGGLALAPPLGRVERLEPPRPRAQRHERRVPRSS